MTNPSDPIFATSEIIQSRGGLTKREYFAALILQGFSANPSMDEEGFTGSAIAAVTQADVLIAALNKEIQ